MRPRFGLDLDGIAYNFDWAARQVLLEMGYPDPSPTLEWDHLAKVNPEGWGDLWTLGVEKKALFHRKDAVASESLRLVRVLKTQGWDVVIVTARPANAEADTTWLAEALGVSEVFRFDDPSEKWKAPVDILIDDSPPAIRACIDNDKPVICFHRPWNAEMNVPVRCATVDAVLAFAENFIKGLQLDPREHTQEIPVIEAPPEVHEVIVNAIHEKSTPVAYYGNGGGNPESREKPEGPCATAQRLVYGDREQSYDHPSRDLRRIAIFWSEVFGVPIDEQQVALAMVFLKGSRLISNPTHKDSEDDLAGWAEVRFRARTGV